MRHKFKAMKYSKVLIIILILTSCVSKSELDALKSEIKSNKQTITSMKQDFERRVGNLEEDKGDKFRLNTKVDSLCRTYDDLIRENNQLKEENLKIKNRYNLKEPIMKQNLGGVDFELVDIIEYAPGTYHLHFNIINNNNRTSFLSQTRSGEFFDDSGETHRKPRWTFGGEKGSMSNNNKLPHNIPMKMRCSISSKGTVLYTFTYDFIINNQTYQLKLENIKLPI